MRIGIIGYGVRVNMLMDVFFKFDKEFEVGAIMDIDHQKVKTLLNFKNADKEERVKYDLDKFDADLRETAMNADNINFYTDADEMLDKENLDGVIVSTNCDTHTMFAQKVLKRNISLFLEKPVAVTLKQLDELQEAYEMSKSEVVVSFPLRATPIAREVKKLIDSGIIGKVENVNAWNDVPYGYVYFHDWYRDEQKTHGLFLQKATHDLDVINYIVGEKPIKICGMKSKQIFKGDMPVGITCDKCKKSEECSESTFNIELRNDVSHNNHCCFAVDTGNEDSGSAIIRYESGMHATYTQNFFARKSAKRRGARFYGYNGTLEFDYTTDTIKIIDHMSDRVEVITGITPEGMHGGGDATLVRNFIDIMKGKAKSIAPLEAGILSAKMCLKAKISSETDTFQEI